MILKRKKKKESGIALFMVMSTVALLAILISELTYTTQMSSRLAYNYVDNVKAYYLVKAAYKLSLIRLKAYLSVKKFIDDPANKMIAEQLPPGTVDQIWSFPFAFPIPIPEKASLPEATALKEFQDKSSLKGSFMAAITGQSNKFNIKNLLVKEVIPDTASGATGASGGTPTPRPTATPTPVPVVFRELLEPAISGILESKKNSDREFASVYRNVFGKDVVDAMCAYLTPEIPSSNLPGFKPIEPKRAPFYSLSELHLIPGYDDTLYDLFKDVLTVYSTAGLNVNSIDKKMLLALIPEMTDTEAEDMLRKRDDKDVGKPWNSEEDFWTAVNTTSASKSIEPIKERFKKGNLKIITSEQSFKIGITATVGQSSRTLEAYVILDPKAADKNKIKNSTGDEGNSAQQQGSPPGVNVAGGQPNANPNENQTSSKAIKGINLIYWRVL